VRGIEYVNGGGADASIECKALVLAWQHASKTRGKLP